MPWFASNKCLLILPSQLSHRQPICMTAFHLNTLDTLLEKTPLQNFTSTVNILKDEQRSKVTFHLNLIYVKIQR